MPSKIIRLPDQLINQIAAGEVVENPASIVKELIENSLDAKASHIEIEIKAAGQQLISVSDDGCGMNQEEALLSLERHATSKIKTFEDFNHLSSMGFRGEALPSIASVSRLLMKTADGIDAILVEVHGGKLIRCEPCARNRGTTIEIRSLFYNTPARKKFQKSQQASLLEILRTITLLALAHPHVAFVLKQNDTLLFEAPRLEAMASMETIKVRASQVLGAVFSQELHSISYQEGSCKVEGVLAPLSQTRPSRKEQYLFVNKRAVVSPLLSYAVKDALATRLEPDRYPLFILNVELPAHLVDVNVHPQKKEVRFREEPFVRNLIKTAVLESLSQESPPSINWSSFDQEKTLSFTSYSFPSSLPLEHVETPLEFKIPLKGIGLFEHYLLLNASALKAHFPHAKEGLVFIDIKETQSVLEYEKIKKSNGKVDQQSLLFPISLKLSCLEMDFVQEHLLLFKRLGFSLAQLSKSAYALETLPPFIDAESAESTFNELLYLLKEGKKEEELFISLCLCMTKKQSRYELSQAEKIAEELLKLPLPWYSLKGKPLIATLEPKEIHALFV